jgi:tRNA1(Val) A37 N6-methylase TrmN6
MSQTSKTEFKTKLLGAPYYLIQYKDISYNLDSILLSDFVKITKDIKSIHDFGTGQGVLLLYLSLKTKKALYGYDIQEDLIQLANKNIENNNLETQIKVFHQDVKMLNEKGLDCIISNPPYFKVSEKSKISEINDRAIARHEIQLTLEDLFVSVNKCLKYQGVFYLIHRADRFEEIMHLSEKYALKPKTIQFVHPYIHKEATQVLIKFNKNGASELKVLPPFILYEKKHIMTQQLKALYKGDL